MALKHTHTYVRYKNRPGYYRCADPKCTHYTDTESLLGKLSRCTSCGSEFILTREDLRRAKPRCLSCSDTQAGKLFRAGQEVMQAASAVINESVGIKRESDEEEIEF